MSKKNSIEYTPEMIEWIRQNIKGKFYRYLYQEFNEKFGTNITMQAMRCTCVRHKLSNGMQRVGFPQPRMFDKEQIEWLRENVKGKTYVGVQALIKEKYNMDLKLSQVKGLLSREHLQTGTKGFFKPGGVPFNKGKKMSQELYEKCAPTMFKKGNIPKNYKPVGSKRITVDGYVEVKIADPSTWKLEHRIVWEKHNGPVPKNHVVVHLDYNKQNNNIENLRLIHRRISSIMNHIKGWKQDPDATNLAIDVAMLKKTITDKKRSK